MTNIEKEVIKNALIFDYDMLGQEEIRLKKELEQIRLKKKSVRKCLQRLDRGCQKAFQQISWSLRFLEPKGLSKELKPCPEK